MICKIPIMTSSFLKTLCAHKSIHSFRNLYVAFTVRLGDRQFCNQGPASALWESYSPPDNRTPVETSYDPTTGRLVTRRLASGTASASIGEDVGQGSGSEDEGERRVYGVASRQNLGFGKSKKGRSRAVWVCEVCGHEDGQWWGTCRACDKVGTMKRFIVEEGGGGGGGDGSKVMSGFEVSENAVRAWLPQKRAGEVQPLKLKDVNRGLNEIEWRIPLNGCFGDEVSRVLGGGLVPGTGTSEMMTNRPRALATGLPSTPTLATIFCSLRFCSAQPQETDSDGSDLDNDSANHSASCSGPWSHGGESTWDDRYRRRANEVVFGREKVYRHDHEDEKRQRVLAKALLEAAIDVPDEEIVEEEHQKSLAVGIIGAPNAGKSALTNFMVGRKVAAVSRKTNTTVHEVLGVLTKGTTQICLFDSPGLMLNCRGFPHKDLKFRVENTWGAVHLYDVLIVLFDVHRHLTRPDARVINLIQRMGAQTHSEQKRILCMNKVDLVEKKKDLLKVAEQFKDLLGYERHFMISALKGSGVKDLTQYLIDQAVERPWGEDPLKMSEEVMKNISMEVVREKLLNYIHQEIPYQIEHRLMDWKELRDGSLRIEQHLITHKESQRKILVGKKGSKIGTIGVEANEELRNIYRRDVHLVLLVRVK